MEKNHWTFFALYRRLHATTHNTRIGEADLHAEQEQTYKSDQEHCQIS